MANQAVTLDAASAKLLIRELEHLEEMKKTILKLLPESLLPRGSVLWWKKTHLTAQEDIKKDRYTTIKTHKDLDRFLDKIS